MSANRVKPEIERTGSRIAYRNRWMTVREDTIVRADGSTGLYGVVEKPDFVAIAALDGRRLTLVEQYRYPIAERCWELPQGSFEHGAIDPLQLAHAELREETGLVAATMIHVARLFPAYGYATQAMDLFLATGLTQGPQQLEVEEQGLVCRAFDIDVVERWILDGTIKDTTTVAAFGLLRMKRLI